MRLDKIYLEREVGALRDLNASHDAIQAELNDKVKRLREQREQLHDKIETMRYTGRQSSIFRAARPDQRCS